MSGKKHNNNNNNSKPPNLLGLMRTRSNVVSKTQKSKGEKRKLNHDTEYTLHASEKIKSHKTLPLTTLTPSSTTKKKHKKINTLVNQNKTKQINTVVTHTDTVPLHKQSHHPVSTPSTNLLTLMRQKRNTRDNTLYNARKQRKILKQSYTPIKHSIIGNRQKSNTPTTSEEHIEKNIKAPQSHQLIFHSLMAKANARYHTIAITNSFNQKTWSVKYDPVLYNVSELQSKTSDISEIIRSTVSTSNTQTVENIHIWLRSQTNRLEQSTQQNKHTKGSNTHTIEYSSLLFAPGKYNRFGHQQHHHHHHASQILILGGKCGVGKTTMLELVLKKHHFRPCWIHARDLYPSKVLEKIANMNGFGHIPQHVHSNCGSRFNCIVITGAESLMDLSLLSSSSSSTMIMDHDHQKPFKTSTGLFREQLGREILRGFRSPSHCPIILCISDPSRVWEIKQFLTVSVFNNDTNRIKSYTLQPYTQNERHIILVCILMREGILEKIFNYYIRILDDNEITQRMWHIMKNWLQNLRKESPSTWTTGHMMRQFKKEFGGDHPVALILGAIQNGGGLGKSIPATLDITTKEDTIWWWIVKLVWNVCRNEIHGDMRHMIIQAQMDFTWLVSELCTLSLENKDKYSITEDDDNNNINGVDNKRLLLSLGWMMGGETEINSINNVNTQSSIFSIISTLLFRKYIGSLGNCDDNNTQDSSHQHDDNFKHINNNTPTRIHAFERKNNISCDNAHTAFIQEKVNVVGNFIFENYHLLVCGPYFTLQIPHYQSIGETTQHSSDSSYRMDLISRLVDCQSDIDMLRFNGDHYEFLHEQQYVRDFMDDPVDVTTLLYQNFNTLYRHYVTMIQKQSKTTPAPPQQQNDIKPNIVLDPKQVGKIQYPELYRQTKHTRKRKQTKLNMARAGTFPTHIQKDTETPENTIHTLESFIDYEGWGVCRFSSIH